MKNILNNFFVTLGMFSKIPVPKRDWDNNNLKYTFIFLPIIGLIIGGLEYIWITFAKNHNFELLFVSAIATALPIFIAGGIHTDGLVDTFDAIASYGDENKRLEVMNDPNMGAFGGIYLCLYFIIYFGTIAQALQNTNWLAAIFVPPIIARVLGGFIMCLEKPARDSGLMKTFKNEETKNVTLIFLIAWSLLCLAFLCLTSLWLGVSITIICILIVICIKKYVYKNFGGFTGDLIGFSISIIEITMLMAIAIEGAI